jgi:hypothetical protein
MRHGFIYHQTFNGNVTYNGDCTATVTGQNQTLNRLLCFVGLSWILAKR